MNVDLKVSSVGVIQRTADLGTRLETTSKTIINGDGTSDIVTDLNAKRMISRTTEVIFLIKVILY